MDLFPTLLLLALAAFCWLLAVGERVSDRHQPVAATASGLLRYRHSPMRAVAPGVVALAALVFGVEAARAGGLGALPLLGAAVLGALLFAALALRSYREGIDYRPGRGLRLRDWRGHRWLGFERMRSIAIDDARRWRPGAELASLVIELDDGTRIQLNERLRGFEDLVARLTRDAPEGVIEIHGED